MSKMNSIVEIDQIDNQILHILIQDARRSLKDIGKECGISSVSVLNRVKRLRELGVITGATLFASLDTFGFHVVASIGMELDSDANVSQIFRFFSEHTYLVEPSTSLGKYDFQAVIYAEDLTKLNERVDLVKRLPGIKRVVVSVWSGIPCLNFENINLMSKDGK
jgi:Lrp/AsnC family transcriptional regulator, regulator for asnA, asnC and gidA